MNELAAKACRNIATTRRLLRTRDDLTAAELREMLLKALDACELLVQGVDRLADQLGGIARNR